MKFITLFIILLISFNINANLVIKKKVAKFDSCRQIMNTGNAQGDNNDRSASNKVTTVSGWQVDIKGGSYCWLMRSSTFRRTNRGSGRCQSSGEPNGTTYGMLWMR